MSTLQEWINAALRVADAEEMANEEVIPTWPADCVERFPDMYPQLTLGALREWRAGSEREEIDQSKQINETNTEMFFLLKVGIEIAEEDMALWKKAVLEFFNKID
jgi:hypothetical protein